MTAILLAVLLDFVPNHEREPDLHRVARFRVVANAVYAASLRATCTDSDPGCVRIWPGSVRSLEAMLLTLGWYESGFTQRIHAGRCRKGECDGGRATSLWQLQASGKLPLPEWRELAGTSEEATERAAWAAARALSVARASCPSAGGWERGTIARYATGRSCSWSGAEMRAVTYDKIWRRLEQP